MKKFKIELTDIPSDKESGKATYVDLIKMCLNAQPQKGGYTYDDFKERERIDEVIKDAKPGDVISFEDSDFKNLQAMEKVILWPFRHPDLTKFIESIREIK